VNSFEGGNEGWTASVNAGISTEWNKATYGNVAAKMFRNYVSPVTPFTYTGPLSFSSTGVSTIKFDFTIADTNNGLSSLKVVLKTATTSYTSNTLTTLPIGSPYTLTVSNIPSGLTLTSINIVLQGSQNSWGEFWVDFVRRCS